ncbi:hypothetical protein Poli38472_000545 [Pythium oligandrum]|uniref:GPR180/TMEM145 transmembrane domain-containing protein n=1 Tax=Pythium oligandrum TaxID=41045 RepID=A0A8K1CDA5_PYTOL|nr:hypothetical protein Poli38472_000545 [Pythium oligandrum]|eukprot:TMW60503.1 hypothetical protein Poli38472_000545 [Pythium oligandrum]
MLHRLLLALLSVLAHAHAAVYSGFTIGRQFEYIGKFCFTYQPTLRHLAGRITGEIQTDLSDLRVALYDDEALFWNYIMTDPSCDCECKLSSTHTKAVFNVSATTDFSIPFEFEMKIHEHLRPRFWYVALARCVPGGDDYHPSFTQITEASFRKYYFSAWYEIHMTQFDGSELAVQEQGLPLIYGLLTLFSGFASVLQTLSARRLHQSESFHPIVKLLTLDVICFTVANGLLFGHFYLYQFNGFGVPLFEYSANILQVFVRVGTILLAMLVAKGWTINSVRLQGQEQLSCLILSVLSLYLSMSMWYLVWLDPASTLYIYDSWPGVGICALHLGVLVWFVSMLLDTRAYEEASNKRRFFLHIGALFAIYIIALPIVVLIASILSPWVREKIVAGVSGAIDLLIYSALIFVLWPTRAPQYFERLYSISSSAEKATLRDQSKLPTEEL